MSTRDRLSKLTADLTIPPAGPRISERTPESDDGGLETKFSAETSAEPAAASGVNHPSHDTATQFPKPTPALETRFPAVLPRPVGRRTGPGDMLAFRGRILEVEGETASLRAKLKPAGLRFNSR